MRKKRKTLGILLCAAISAVALFGAACEKDEAAHEHAYGAWETTVAATCAKEGERERVCSCGDKQVEKIAKTEHAHVKTVDEQASTCAVKGHSSYKKCEDCGQNIIEPTELPLAEHSPVDVEAKEPSCFEAGNTAGKKCSVCGAILEGEALPATGKHAWNNGVQTKAPEYQVAGETTYTCTTPGCGATKTEEIPALTYAPSDIWDGSIATAFAGGSGVAGDPYLISNAKELAYLAQQVNQGESYGGKIFVLTKDIILNDISDYENWNEKTKGLNTWTSIGLDSEHSFAGSIYGDGHAVRGMYGVSTGAGTKCIGLFGYVDSVYASASFRKVSITEAYVYAKTTVGGLAAVLNSRTYVSEAEFSGKLYGYTAGGIFGEVNSIRSSGDVEIEQSKTSGNIECIEEPVRNSVSNGYVGGAIGKLTYKYSSVNVHLVENFCFVKGAYAGGIVGAAYPDDKSDSSHSVRNFELRSCKNRGQIGDMAKVDNCVIGGIAGEAKFRANSDANNEACIQTVYFCNSYNYGVVKAVSSNSSAGGIAGNLWIYGRYSTNPSDTLHANFFTMQNFGAISANYTAGGIFGTINVSNRNATVEMSSCLNEGKVSVDLSNKSGSAGGIVGYSAQFKYSTCYNAGEIVSYGRAGGLVGSAGDIECKNSFNRGKVSSNTYAGGLVGYGGNLKLDCVYNSGVVGVVSTKEKNAKFGAIYGNGNSSSQTTCCYYLDGTVNSSGGYNGNKLSEEQMKDLSNFERFGSYWEIDADSDYKYPVFRNLKVERDA